jgi:hypothetical protein
VIEKNASWPQEPAHRAEVLSQTLQTYVLEHADAGDFVERVLDAIGLTVVSQFDPTALGQAGLFNPLLRHLFLFSTQRNSLSMHMVFVGGTQHQTAPPTPDVQEPFLRLKPQLSADQV